MLRYMAPLHPHSSQLQILDHAPFASEQEPAAGPVHLVLPSDVITAPRKSAELKLSALIRKLSAFGHLDVDEIEALNLLSRNAKPMRSEQILIHEGSPTSSVYLIVSGMACRYKMLAGGRRQILGFLIPGDLCDMQFAIANRPDFSVALVGNATVARIPTSSINDLMLRYPKINRALLLASLIDSMILREWLLNVGQRNALQSLCHLFCEMTVRLEAIGGNDDDGTFELPINQVTLADTLGLTPVHINRTLQRLRNEGMIKFCNRRLAILDRDRLAAAGGFDGAYLRLDFATR